MEGRNSPILSRIGIIGLVVGAIALGLAVFQGSVRAAFESNPDPTLKELAIDAGKKLIKEKILEQQVEPKESRDAVSLARLGLGFAAILCGVVSWIRHDHVRVSGGAVALGLIAVAWQFVLIGVGIAIVIFILANLSA